MSLFSVVEAGSHGHIMAQSSVYFPYIRRCLVDLKSGSAIHKMAVFHSECKRPKQRKRKSHSHCCPNCGYDIEARRQNNEYRSFSSSVAEPSEVWKWQKDERELGHVVGLSEEGILVEDEGVMLYRVLSRVDAIVAYTILSSYEGASITGYLPGWF